MPLSLQGGSGTTWRMSGGPYIQRSSGSHCQISMSKQVVCRCITNITNHLDS